MTLPLSDPALKTRSAEIDFCKGVLITLIVMFHITFIGSARPALVRVTTLVYGFHIPAFFLLSGYFLRLNRPPMQQVQLAWRRVIVPYLIFEPIYLMMLHLLLRRGFSVSTIPPVGLRAWLDTLIVHPLGAFWYLHDLGLALLVWAMSTIIARRCGGKPFLAVILFGSGLLALSLTDVVHFYNMSYLVLGAAMGIMALPIPQTGWLALPAVLIVWRVGFAVERGSSASLVLCLCAIGILCALFDALRGAGTVGRAFVHAGRNSLAVMVFHPFFINAFKPSARVFLRVDGSGVMYVVVVVFTTVTLSVLLMGALDRTRLASWLFGEKSYRPWENDLIQSA